MSVSSTDAEGRSMESDQDRRSPLKDVSCPRALPHSELRCRLGRDVPVHILVVRPDTSVEIEFCHWGDESLAREGMGRRV
jgi:hypothetical protein